MRTSSLIRMGVVTASVIAAGASATAPPATNSTNPPESPIPDRRLETVTTETSVDGIDIAVEPAGAAAWRFVVKNNTDALASIVWDESVFVSASGESGGRLIRGETRKIDSAKAQPATPIPPSVMTREIALVEKLVEVEDVEVEYWRAVKRNGTSSLRLNEIVMGARKDRNRMLAGGSLNLTIQLTDGKKTWTGRVSGGKTRVEAAE